MIQLQGDELEGFWLVESGRVAICRIAADGSATTYAILGASDLFGELAHFTGLPRQVDALAEGEASLVRVDGMLVERLLAAEPSFARWLLRSLANQLRAALDRIDRDRTQDAAARLAGVIANLAQRADGELQLSQQALADLAGISRVTAGQVLGRLAKSGAIELGYRRIAVRNPAALRRFSS